MSDLISRSALMNATIERLKIGKRADGVFILRETITAQELDTLLTDAPAVDAVPAAPARWIYSGETDEDGNCEANCSVCGAGDKHRPDLKDAVPYCWKCGARMDGEAPEEEG